MATQVATKSVPYKEKAPFDYTSYIRKGKLPHIWCPGCGHGIVMKSLLRAIHATGLPQDDIAMVSGIGCSSRTPGYLDFNTLHTLHGRAIAYATGIKLAKPKLKVIITTGDGDALAIGGNHFIHACRRNMDMVILVYNNYIYGMTSGQSSPTTPQGMIATTAKYGSIEPTFDTCNLAKAAGATFVARGTAYHCQELEKTLYEAIMHKGTAVVDILDSCPTYYGRFNKVKGNSELMVIAEKEGTVSQVQAEKMTPEQLQGKLVRGVLHKTERPEYCEEYEKLMAKAQGK
ncbi:MAG TPA: 2-oxoacid:ferredoxin oxidoreductase subunit beta [Thermodesulfobacteriota bacterium]|nr:2-oxoacid:ferredoxin oxidoreductase subunit beta [Thermodesulfobacteriota bacterium]